MRYKDFILFKTLVAPSQSTAPVLDFDNAHISRIEQGRVDKTRLRLLLVGALSRGMAYAELLDAKDVDVLERLKNDTRVIGKTLNQVLDLAV